MLETIQQKIIEWIIGSGRFATIIRHGVNALGAWLVSIGLEKETVSSAIDPITNILVGLAMIAFAYISSRQNKKELPTP